MQESMVSRMAQHDADVDVSVIKIVSLIGFTCLMAVFCGLFVLNSEWFYAGLFLVFFWTAFTMQAIFIKSWKKIFLAVSIESACMAFPIATISNSYFSIYFLSILAILFTSLITAEMSARDTIKDALHISFWRVTREVLMKIVTGVLVFVSLAYIFFIGGSNIMSTKTFSDDSITSAVSAIDKDLSSSSTTLEVLRKVVLRTLSGDNLRAFNNLSESQKSASLNASAIALFSSFSGYLGLTNIDAPISKSVSDALQNKFFSLSPAIQFYVFLSFGVLLWFLARVLAFILYFPLAFIAYITYETLLAIGFAILQYESRSREIVILS